MPTASTRDLNRLRRLSRSLDKQLLRVIQYGRPVYDADGKPVLDAEGNQVCKPASAADMAAATRRLRQTGIKFREPPKSTREEIIQNMEDAGLKFDGSKLDADGTTPATTPPPPKPSVPNDDTEEPAAEHTDPLTENVELKQRLAQLEA